LGGRVHGRGAGRSETEISPFPLLNEGLGRRIQVKVVRKGHGRVKARTTRHGNLRGGRATMFNRHTQSAQYRCDKHVAQSAKSLIVSLASPIPGSCQVRPFGDPSHFLRRPGAIAFTFDMLEALLRGHFSLEIFSVSDFILP
jgi:hypothetical protein